MRRNGRYPFSQTHAALALCVLIHIALFLLLRDALRGPVMRVPSAPMAVTLIESTSPESPPELQVMPFVAQAVKPKPKTALAPRAAVAPTLADTPTTKSGATATPDLPNAQQLIDSMAQAAAAIAHGDAPADRGFLAHRKARLPSSDQTIVAGIELRKQTSLKTIVQGVTKGLHGAFACNGSKHDTAPLNSEKLIASPIAALMDRQYDIGPEDEDCLPEN